LLSTLHLACTSEDKNMQRITLRIREAIALGTAAGLLTLGCNNAGQSGAGDATAPASGPPTVTPASTGPLSPLPTLPKAADGGDPTVTVAAGHPGGFTQCRTHAGAVLAAVGPEKNERIDCPLLIVADDTRKPAARGTLDVFSTKERRALADGGAAAPDECCYEVAGNWGNRGRPFVDDGRAVLAGIPDRPAELPAPAERWLSDARAEHASIASFARSILELMAVGAPLDLLEASQQALADEIRHARACLDLAEQHAGTSLAFGPLPALAPRSGGLRRVALDTFDEGCVSETISAIEAARAVDEATDPAVRAVLARIAEDEAAHAALAWRTLAWALAADGTDALRGELRARAGELRRGALVASAADDANLPAAAARSAWEKVIAPTLADLLNGAPAQRS
jgi:hypothetical protein